MSRTGRGNSGADILADHGGRAEVIAGRLTSLDIRGDGVGLITGAIFASLQTHARSSHAGKAFTGSLAYIVPTLTSGRQSFSPDASYYDGPPPGSKADFIPNPPTFAVEIRSKSERGPSGEAERAAKRADYFEAGTVVVWDVDPFGETIQVYRNSAPDRPQTYRNGDVAEAEPAVPGWTIPVADIFAE